MLIKFLQDMAIKTGSIGALLAFSALQTYVLEKERQRLQIAYPGHRVNIAALRIHGLYGSPYVLETTATKEANFNLSNESNKL